MPGIIEVIDVGLEKSTAILNRVDAFAYLSHNGIITMSDLINIISDVTWNRRETINTKSSVITFFYYVSEFCLCCW